MLRTTLYYNSFLPSSIRLWNDLTSDIRNNTPINSFRTYLNRNTLPANPVFFYGDRKSQILHIRLRLKCSSLNNHLFLKKISLTPQTVSAVKMKLIIIIYLNALFIITYILSNILKINFDSYYSSAPMTNRHGCFIFSLS